ncbi:hypothetical protein R5R35_005902 [Gryllus longicercus]|uniref:Uncharacterized protein n=1 Tax=Gryllus longicercus TaxID=2509291 RepID=A0AAN9VEX4_9ORTH
MEEVISERDVEKSGASTSGYDTSSKSSRNKKRHLKTKSKLSVTSGILEGLEEDVLEVTQHSSETGSASQQAILEHNISERLFVQKKKGFEPASRGTEFEKSFHDLSQSQEIVVQKEELTPHEFAIYLYNKTRQFFTFCHGILGGFGVAHISLVFSIGDSPEAVQRFAEGYPDFARVVQILYYVLSAICFVSVLDRCDFAGLKLIHCIDFMRYRWADILTIIFYLGLLIVTIVCVQWDDRLALSSFNEDLWKDSHVSHSEFMQWRLLSLLRGFFAVAGYMTMFFGPEDDLFFIHLSNMIKQDQKQEESHEARY